MRAFLIAIIFGLVVLMWLAGMLARPAHAQQQCAPLPEFLALLAANYQEAPRVSALAGGDALLIITAGDSGTWTALMVQASGMACMVASGVNFEVQDAPPPGDPL